MTKIMRAMLRPRKMSIDRTRVEEGAPTISTEVWGACMVMLVLMRPHWVRVGGWGAVRTILFIGGVYA